MVGRGKGGKRNIRKKRDEKVEQNATEVEPQREKRKAEEKKEEKKRKEEGADGGTMVGQKMTIAQASHGRSRSRMSEEGSGVGQTSTGAGNGVGTGGGPLFTSRKKGTGLPIQNGPNSGAQHDNNQSAQQDTTQICIPIQSSLASRVGNGPQNGLLSNIRGLNPNTTNNGFGQQRKVNSGHSQATNGASQQTTLATHVASNDNVDGGDAAYGGRTAVGMVDRQGHIRGLQGGDASFSMEGTGEVKPDEEEENEEKNEKGTGVEIWKEAKEITEAGDGEVVEEKRKKRDQKRSKQRRNRGKKNQGRRRNGRRRGSYSRNGLVKISWGLGVLVLGVSEVFGGLSSLCFLYFLYYYFLYY